METIEKKCISGFNEQCYKKQKSDKHELLWPKIEKKIILDKFGNKILEATSILSF